MSGNVSGEWSASFPSARSSDLLEPYSITAPSRLLSLGGIWMIETIQNALESPGESLSPLLSPHLPTYSLTLRCQPYHLPAPFHPSPHLQICSAGPPLTTGHTAASLVTVISPPPWYVSSHFCMMKRSCSLLSAIPMYIHSNTMLLVFT